MVDNVRKRELIMKNPLRKRYIRELRKDFGKYLVICLFLVFLISLVSGFLVADNNFHIAYEEGFEKYNCEDGHIAFNIEPSEELLRELEERAELTFYDLKYFDEDINDDGKTLRVYKTRDKVNTACIFDGELPVNEDEIALDRMFAKNNDLEIGDTVTIRGKDLRVTCLVALVDYSCLFENNSDMMFDSINFGVAFVSEDAFEYIDSPHITYNYAWKYDVSPVDDIDNKNRSEEFIEILEEVITDYDTNIVQSQIDELYELGEELESNLETQLTEAFEGMQMLVMEYPAEYGSLAMILSDADTSSLESIKRLITEIDETGLYDVSEILNTIASIEELENASIDESDIVDVCDYVPRYINNAINFTGDDMGKDAAMITIFNYIVLAVLAFVIAVTITNTISQEAGVIGTLRATGYSRGELLLHYITLPVWITIIGAVVGNLLGYTVLKDVFADIYYNSYSLATYENHFLISAFIQTTVVPVMMMIVINFVALYVKLKISPLKFLRRELSKRRRKKSVRLNTRIPIMHRFRLRILFQNISAYVTLAIGIFLGSVLIVFGSMLGPLLDDYATLVVDTRICDYQYVLINQAETNSTQAEKFSLTSLDLNIEGYITDSASIYGISEDSQYITSDIPEGTVLVSNGLAEKYNLEIGDEVIFDDHFSTKTYSFVVGGVYTYDAGIAAFVNIDEYKEIFGESKDAFTGYFSNEELDDIDEDDIATIITINDLLKLSNQLKVSMGEFMNIFKAFGMIMFMLLIYIMTKLIIEKNMVSIALTKILGFKNNEINGLYLLMTFFVVAAALLISIPVTDTVLRIVFSSFLYKMMSGYIPYIISSNCYLTSLCLGIVSFIVVAAFMMIKISKIPKSEALKNVE